ncbi:lipocalin family protein [Marivirga sp.]|uniref:lipocalin family protein n=1 Tax=Marivirga sp. TaxID=2018662 RepID=UPI002D8075B6|nr:lipocalin family protein [Marivirga sp.]HET8859042.1 lipocalin family protein [Marivirga sp.]
MMKTLPSLFNFALVFCAILFTVSCSLEKNIIGTWQIASYSEESSNGSNANAKNIGEIVLEKNGSGYNDLSYRILGNERVDKTEFTYNVNDENITIKTDDQSELAKSWIIIESKRKYQRWKSTDGKGNVQTLILIKE